MQKKYKCISQPAASEKPSVIIGYYNGHIGLLDKSTDDPTPTASNKPMQQNFTIKYFKQF